MGIDMYESPINLIVTNIYNQIMEQQENEIYKAVLNYVPDVNKEELIRALKCDRDQYDKGYADGKRDALDELVRCKDCKHYYQYSGEEHKVCGIFNCDESEGYPTEPEDFCSYGERE